MQNVEKEINKHKLHYLATKRERRIKKRTDKRDITGEEVIFIFEKVLERWPTIKIFNTIKQTTPASAVTKKKVEVIATGNCKVFENELEPARYQHYLELRPKVYDFLKQGGVVGAEPLFNSPTSPSQSASSHKNPRNDTPENHTTSGHLNPALLSAEALTCS